MAAIVDKDLRTELRTKEIVTSLLVFVLLVLFIFNFAFEPRAETIALVAPGVLWVAFVFAGMLGLNRSFVMEHDRGCMEGLMLCPVDRSAIYLGKMVGNLAFMLVVEVIAFPFFSIFFNLPLLLPGAYLMALLGTLGFAGVGTLFSAMSVNTKAREILLPLLLFPIVVPVLIAGVKATAIVVGDTSGGSIWPWVRLVAAFDAIFLIISSLTFEFAIEQ
ncbi:MAG: heme exporter protein CcmB [Chloroflexi bacterium]|nr:heme exporter protein CcmB [Chloroflexota bacterium]